MIKEAINNVAEGNKLIAEFMGGQVMPDGRCAGYTKMRIPEWAFRLHDFDSIRVGGYGYDRSWDWLMPVVDKMTWKNDYHFIDEVAEKEVKNLKESLFFVDIDLAFRSVVSLIKWYNSQPA